MAFYKNDNGFLLWSADRVINENFELWLDKKDTYSYPVEGWIWAETDVEARNTLQCYGRQPFPSWTIHIITASWQPPTPKPEGINCYWDEQSLSWQNVTEL